MNSQDSNPENALPHSNSTNLDSENTGAAPDRDSILEASPPAIDPENSTNPYSASHLDSESHPFESLDSATSHGPVFHSLSPGYIPAERIAGLIVLAIVLVGGLIGLGFKFFHGGLNSTFYWLLAAFGAVLLLQFWSAVFFPRIAYRNIKWRLGEFGLEIHRGVIWKSRASVPLARVQHADVSQGPIQRVYDLGTLIVHTAGSRGVSSVELEGLNHDVAIDMRDRLVRQKIAESHEAAE